MAELDPAAEHALAEMTAEDFAALTARVRAPTSSEQLKTAAAKHVPEGQLDNFMAIANVKAFADEHGNIDEAKVSEHCGRFFGTGTQQPPAARQWGQHTGPGQPPEKPGAGGRAALEKRHGVSIGDAAQSGSGPGAAGRAEAARRHGGKTR